MFPSGRFAYRQQYSGRLLVPQNQPVLGEKAHLRGEVLSKAQGPAGPGLDGDFQQRVRMLQEPAWLAASKVRMKRLAEIPLPCAHPSVMQVAPPKESANPRVGTLTQQARTFPGALAHGS